jgi:ubiquinone/menaquinone biosynthesis C-methylase UbiE
MPFEELKQRQALVWGLGAFENIQDTIADVHDRTVEALAPAPGERWLELACGTGALAERAARAGALVTGVDLSPALVRTARERAREQGLEIDYRVGDCERLELEDGSFDVVSSTFGIMFAPDHAATARELARVVRRGGRLGLANWRDGGAIQEMFRMTAPFSPPPPPGAGSPFDWGAQQQVKRLLGGAFELRFEDGVSTLRAASGEENWQLFATHFGPIKAIVDTLEPDRREEFHRTWVEFFETRHAVDGGIEQPREYLLVLGTRR